MSESGEAVQEPIFAGLENRTPDNGRRRKKPNPRNTFWAFDQIYRHPRRAQLLLSQIITPLVELAAEQPLPDRLKDFVRYLLMAHVVEFSGGAYKQRSNESVHDSLVKLEQVLRDLHCALEYLPRLTKGVNVVSLRLGHVGAIAKAQGAGTFNDLQQWLEEQEAEEGKTEAAQLHQKQFHGPLPWLWCEEANCSDEPKVSEEQRFAMAYVALRDIGACANIADFWTRRHSLACPFPAMRFLQSDWHGYCAACTLNG